MKPKKPNHVGRIAGLIVGAAVAGGLSLCFAIRGDRVFVATGHESLELYALTMGCLCTGAAAIGLAGAAAIDIVEARKKPTE